MKKTVTIMMLLITLFITLWGCGKSAEEGEPTERLPEGELSADTAAEATEEWHETEAVMETETVAETEEAAPEPTFDENGVLTVTTEGRVVLIGKVGRDDKGWFITAEEPFNVNLNSTADAPLYYESVTRVGMFEITDDGIDKSIYLGSVVTVEGVLSLHKVNNRNESLFISTENITMGKNAERIHGLAEPTLSPFTENIYDIGEKLPDEMNVTLKNGVYTYNPYILSKDAVRYFGNEFAYFYVDFVNAYLNYESSCPCPKREYARMLSQVLFYECPFFEANGIYEYTKDYDGQNKRIIIRYKNDRNEHDRLMTEFFSAANGFLADTSEGQSETERARAIYHSLCTAVKYDYDALEKLNKNGAYHAYASNSGVCITFANAYIQLLTQTGIDATVVSGLMVNGEAHVWDYVILDGNGYFCDPTFETGRNNGEGYIFFGMSHFDRTKDGTGHRGMSIGRYVTKNVDEVEISAESLG